MNRSSLFLGVVVAALAAVYGLATAEAPAPGSTAAAAGRPAATAAERKPVQRTTLLCPSPAGSAYLSTGYAAYTPAGAHQGSGGSARLADGTETDGADFVTKPSAKAKPVLPLSAPGKPATSTAGKTAYPLIGTADGQFAPGWTVQETTTIFTGTGQGVLGTACGQAGDDFWFPGASTATGRADYVHLTNPDDTAAAVDVELYGDQGQIKAPGGEAMAVPGRSSLYVLLSSLTGQQAKDVTVHVSVRTGRVAAAVQAMNNSTPGSDWLAAAAPPADSAVLPGIPHDATSVRLIGYATGAEDADLKVQLLTPTGPITPAGHETVHLRAGRTTAYDLPKLTQGQAGSLRLTPSDPGQAAPFVAALQITRGKNGNSDFAFIPATAPVGPRATAADNTSAKGSTLALTAPEGQAVVKITSSAGSKGGTPVTRTVTVKAGSTRTLNPPAPKGGGSYAITVEPVSGGPVYAARELSRPSEGLPAFTIQTLPDDGGFVVVPGADQDLSVLER